MSKITDGKGSGGLVEFPKPRTDHSILTTVIPQVYVDIIGRLVPGVVTLVMLGLALFGWPKNENWPLEVAYQVPDIVVGSLVLVSAYVTGHMTITPIRFLLRAKRGKKRVGETNSSPTVKTLSAMSEATRFDFIKYIDPDGGHRVSKLRAEANMATGICVGSAMTLVALAFPRPNPPVVKILIPIACLGLAASFVVTRYCRIATRQAIINLSEMHGFERWVPLAEINSKDDPAKPKERT